MLNLGLWERGYRQCSRSEKAETAAKHLEVLHPPTAPPSQEYGTVADGWGKLVDDNHNSSSQEGTIAPSSWEGTIVLGSLFPILPSPSLGPLDYTCV